MLQKIVSFGFRHGSVPEAGPGIVVLDVRKTFRNPYHDRSLRTLPGTDIRVQQEILTTPNFECLYQHLKQQVLVPGTCLVYIGCTGGHHRSVFLAEKLAKELGVKAEHRDLHKP